MIMDRSIRIPYGEGHLVLSSEQVDQVVISRINDMKRDGQQVADFQTEIIEKAMEKPLGSPALEKLAEGKKKAVIIISDHTRPVPSRYILPPMLKALRKGNPQMDITLLVATGCHRGTTEAELRAKLGDILYQQERVVVHDCDDEENLVSLGKLPSGAELIINRLAAECDLLLAEGFIEPHFFAGFSGGRKSVLPGICSRKTVLGNHCSRFIDSPYARMGILEGNPIHRDMEAAAEMAHLAYILNVIVDEEKKVVAAFAGDGREAHLAGCKYLSSFCQVPVTKKNPIVITSNGGAPLDQNVYQAVKGMAAAEPFTEEGGIIILCAKCSDGMGGDLFYEKMAHCSSLSDLMEEVLATPMEETIPDQWQYQILLRIMLKFHVILVCDQAVEKQVVDMKLDYAPDLESALEKARAIAGKKAAITVIPDGVSVIGEV